MTNMSMVVGLQLNVSSKVQLVYQALLTYQPSLEMLTGSGWLVLPHDKNRYRELSHNEGLRFLHKDNKSLCRITSASCGISVLE